MAQGILMEKNVFEKDSTKKEFGPNEKHYFHNYIAFGYVLDQPEKVGADIETFGSFDFMFGMRYKRRFNNFYAMGLDLRYRNTSLKLKQDSSKILPDNVLHDKEKLHFNAIDLEFYNRFNFGKRGNHIGKFLDIGAYGNWNFSESHETKDEFKVANYAGASVTYVSNKRLVYLNAFNYGLAARIGFGKFVLYGTYRLSDIVTANSIYPELPRIVGGIQIGLHK